MTTRRPVLGKGLSALIPTANREAAPATAAVATPAREDTGRRVLDLPLNRVVRNRYQARQEFDKEALADLAASIKENGILQPLAVRALPNEPGRYELIAGERRFRAAEAVGLKTVPVLVFEANDQELSVLSLVENLQRVDLNPMEEAEGLQSLVDHFSLTQEDIAARVGKSRSAVANSLRLLGLPESVRNGLAAGEITAGHARALLALGRPDEIISAYGDVVGKAMSVRETERHVKRLIAARERLLKRKPAAASDTEPADPNRDDLLRRVRERLSTKLTLTGGEKGGRIEIHYYSAEDRDRLLEILARE